MAKCEKCEGSFGIFELKNKICPNCLDKENTKCLSCKVRFKLEVFIEGYCKSCYQERKVQQESRINSELNKKVILLLKLKEESLSNSYMIYNVPINGKSLGMVDVGLVARFNAKSSGNSFENGVIQYAIETSSEKVWADNNSQYNSVQEIKNQLKIKAISLFPESNAIENFNITFRELGSSGNVFIYASGTASIPESIENLKENREIQLIIEEIKKMKLLKSSLKNFQMTL